MTLLHFTENLFHKNITNMFLLQNRIYRPDFISQTIENIPVFFIRLNLYYYYYPFRLLIIFDDAIKIKILSVK